MVRTLVAIHDAICVWVFIVVLLCSGCVRDISSDRTRRRVISCWLTPDGCMQTLQSTALQLV